MNKAKIEAKYQALHSALGKQKDAEDKEAFDIAHRKVWHDCDIELQARKTKLVTKATLTLKETKELRELEFLFPTPLEPTPEEIRVKELLNKSPTVITKEEMWEVIQLLNKGKV